MPTIICNGKEVELIHACFPRPTSCPICNSPTKIDGAYTRCTNVMCDGIMIGKINNWVKKTGIKYFGQSRQKTCFNAGIVKTPANLYDLTTEKLGAVIGDGNASMVSRCLCKTM